MRTRTALTIGGLSVVAALTSIELALIFGGHVDAALDVLAGVFWLVLGIAFLWAVSW